MFEAVTKPEKTMQVVLGPFRGKDPTWHLNDTICVRFYP